MNYVRSAGVVAGMVLLVALLAVRPHPAIAQDQAASVSSSSPLVRLTFGGLLQARGSYNWTTNLNENSERLGWGIRRARLTVDAAIGPRAGVEMQLAGGNGTMELLDFAGIYEVSDRLRLRLGRFVSAQPRANQLTSSTRLDDVARAAIAERWEDATIGGSGRDFGLEAAISTEEAEVLVFLHNGDGSWSRLRGNVRDDISGGDVTRGLNHTDLAFSTYGAYRPASVPGLETGAFLSVNTSKNPNTERLGQGRNTVSYGAHLYWGAEPGSQPVRVKFDALGISYQAIEVGASTIDQQTVGLALFGAGQLHPAAEAFARLEYYDPDTQSDGADIYFATAGASLSISALRGHPFRQERLTLAYKAAFPEMDTAPRHHQLVLQAQLVF